MGWGKNSPILDSFPGGSPMAAWDVLGSGTLKKCQRRPQRSPKTPQYVKSGYKPGREERNKKKSGAKPENNLFTRNWARPLYTLTRISSFCIIMIKLPETATAEEKSTA
jgi:hypothetical protein